MTCLNRAESPKGEETKQEKEGKRKKQRGSEEKNTGKTKKNRKEYKMLNNKRDGEEKFVVQRNKEKMRNEN